jgi:hypothetical protein
MENLPSYVSLMFILITIVSLWLFYLASNKNKLLTGLIILIAAVMGAFTSVDFFLVTDTLPPRLFYLIAPGILLMVFGFATKTGRSVIDQFDLEIYGYLHTVRIAVEIVLLWLFIYQLIPESMTFEGRNFDILTGLTAPFIGYFGYRKQTIKKGYVLLWNILGLMLVLQVVITGILSAPTVFQQLSFDQPNIAVLYFPFVWLPGIVVPIVIFGHLISIRNYFKTQDLQPGLL